MVDDSTIPVLWTMENTMVNAIIKYLSDKFNILKSENQEKIALNNQWIDWSNSVFGLNCSTYDKIYCYL